MFRCRCGQWFPDRFGVCPTCGTPVDLDYDVIRDFAAEQAEDEADLQDMRAERGDGLTRRDGRL